MAESFFARFSPEEIARISAAGTRVTMPEGWSPIWEDTPAEAAYIILEGRVSVLQHGTEIARLGPGDIVGEAALAHHSLRTASIVALTSLDLIHLGYDALERLDQEMPSFHDALDQVASERFGTPG
ncbi:Crp/Fnr family transcriptional regulator [Nocardioides insulae]|uniref:Crp/Fnr family transcriptional regulator n=1 Tax=Nocardioides insulae TaxID=394734 RepID=UPI000411E8A2|nr:cyclic nucleotide-binding domain-containing protein [Nocardioides insulae]